VGTTGLNFRAPFGSLAGVLPGELSQTAMLYDGGVRAASTQQGVLRRPLFLVEKSTGDITCNCFGQGFVVG